MAFYGEKHSSFILGLDSKRDSRLEYVVSEHLRLSAVYWGLCAMETLGHGSSMDKAAIAALVQSCRRADGGYSGSIGHDSHLLHTLSALQLLALCDGLGGVDVEGVVGYLRRLQRADGAFAGDAWGEVDTRFTYCALQAAALVGRLDALDLAGAVAFVGRCRNFDGGYGAVPGGESHAGQIFCCLGALSIAGALGPGGPGRLDPDLLGWWLAERQVDSGGLNGRPEKQSDVCYSWWILSCLGILGKVQWIDGDALARFILECQDEEGGGIADRPGNVADVYHTFFGVAGLSLLGKLKALEPAAADIDPVFALPAALVEKLGLKSQRL